MRQGWWRHALQLRLGAVAAAALVLWTVMTAVAATIATRGIGDAILRERQVHGRAIASRVELQIENDLRQLDLIAAAATRSSSEPALAEQVRRVRLGDDVLRIDRSGRILWSRSVANGAPATSVVEHFSGLGVEGWHVEGTDVVSTRQGPRAFLVLPARESDPAGGAVAAVVNPATSPLRALLAAYRDEPYRVELIDEKGREIAASRPNAAGTGGTDDLLLATVPIGDSRWRVRLAEPRDQALAPVLRLRRILVGSSLLLLPFAVVVAVAAARSIRYPVLVMTTTAERLARGELTVPIPPAGEDEIGRLAFALERLRASLESDERRGRLLKHVITAQEEERRRIARELHDQTTQQLTAIAMQLDTVSAAQPETGVALGHARTIIRSAIDDLHRLIYGLRPSMLDDLGLLPAIRSYAETHLHASGVDVHTEFPATLPDLPREAATALYRVAQEAINNVARHARAETILIGCTVAGGRFVLEVEDDGVGFDPAAVTRPRPTGEGLGLLGMRERLALFGGTLDVESEPGRGTRVVAVLPLETHAGAAPA